MICSNVDGSVLARPLLQLRYVCLEISAWLRDGNAYLLRELGAVGQRLCAEVVRVPVVLSALGLLQWDRVAEAMGAGRHRLHLQKSREHRSLVRRHYQLDGDRGLGVTYACLSAL